MNVSGNTATANVIAMGKSVPITFDGTEGGLFSNVGNLLKFIPVPNSIRVVMGNEYADFNIDEEGVTHFVCSGLKLKRSRYEKKYLTKIDPETNSYNFYKIIPYNMGPRTLSCGGSYGRIGAATTDLNAETIIKSPYPSCMYWLKYYEKLNQGYQDYTDIMLEKDEELERMFQTNGGEEIAEDVVAELYNKLRQFAKDAISSQVDVNFLSEKPPFTKTQVANSWKIWKDLGNSKTVDEFNKKLLKLLAISPRRVDKFRGQTINSYLAATGKTEAEQKEIFANIIAREESLLQAMDAVVNTVSKFSNSPVLSPFGNIEISIPTEDEINKVKSYLSSELVPKVKKIYRVVCNEQQEKFDTYVADNNIQDIRMFWHGSRNENWISIIKNSLMLNPNAVISGKMWGYGIYFAPSAMKSWGYTSYHNTRWANGNSGTAFMGLYATAYGTPYFPTHLMNGTAQMMKDNHTNCLHAKAGVSGLMNDEVIFYDEAAVCLQYLVEFGD